MSIGTWSIPIDNRTIILNHEDFAKSKTMPYFPDETPHADIFH